MNHIKKAEIVFPEISDRKIHVKRRVTVETGKQTPPQTEWQSICEYVTVVTFATLGFFFLLAIVAVCGVKP